MLQSTLLTGISSPRLRRCSVGEEMRALFQKFSLLLSCFTLVWSLHKHFPKWEWVMFWVYPRLSRECWVSKFLHRGDGYPRIASGLWTFMNIRLSKLRLLLIGLDHRARTFLFACLILFQGVTSGQQRVGQAQVS